MRATLELTRDGLVRALGALARERRQDDGARLQAYAPQQMTPKPERRTAPAGFKETDHDIAGC